MATSPNYSWPEPDNTDLVKNGALAIRTMGNAIDTTMATMTPKSTFTAKGSIAAATAASTPANLSVGNNGETLVSDSATPTGLRYTAGTVQANPILNSAFQCWQRGTSVAVTTGTSNNYTADRWALSVGANQAATVARQATNDTTNLPFIQYCARVQRNSGQTGTGAMNFDQSIETINSIPYVGKSVTVSFYARAGANYSPTSSVLTFQLVTGTGTDQNISTSTGTAVASSTNATLTTTWQRFTFTTSIATSVTQLFLRSASTPTGTAGTNDYYEITGVQLDIGSVALPFRTYAGTLQGELSAAMRYYERNSANSTATSQDLGTMAYANGTTSGFFHYFYKVTKRTIPSFSYSGTYQLTDAIANNYAITSMSLNTSTSNETLARLNVGVASGLTSKNIYFPQSNATATSYIEFSAEL